MELWSAQLADFLAEVVGERPALLVGNSVGSLACLITAAEVQERVTGLVLLNCAGGMNNKAIAGEGCLRGLVGEAGGGGGGGESSSVVW